MSILWLDDEIEQLELVQMFAELSDSLVSTESSSEKIAEIIKNGDFKYDVIVTDQKMPSYSGEDIIRLLKNSGYENVKTIIVSGHIGDTVKKNLSNMGVDKIFNKPIEIDTVLDCAKGFNCEIA